MKTVKHFVLAALLTLISISGFAQQDGNESEAVNQEELEQILAPIALYPDTVLAHILVAATYPLDVIQAERWVTAHPDLQGTDAVEALDDRDWDPSVRALAAFPHVLKRLSDDLEWTQKLGTAFLENEEALLAGVQSLRQRAYQEGSLDDLNKVSVTHEDNAIIIEPVEREVVYLPYYDTRRVYGAWRSSYYPPIHWDCPYHNHHYAGYRHDPFYWGPRFQVSFGFFFSSFHWRNHNVVRIPRSYYNPRRHYNHHQILRHHNVKPWNHDRRGTVYRDSRSNSRIDRLETGSRNAIARQNSRVTLPNRIRQELRERRTDTNEQNRRVNNNKTYPRLNQSQPRVIGSTSQNRDQRRSAPNVARPATSRSVVKVTPQVRSAARASAPNRPNVVKVPRAVAPKVQRQAPQPAKPRQVTVRQEQKQASSRARPSNPARGNARTKPR